MTKEIKICPSILAADPGRLETECRRAQDAGADSLHLDIMDGQFVKNISLGFAVIAAAKSWVDIPLTVHLMILRPDWYVERCVEMGAHTVMIHIEAPCDTAETIEKIRRAGGHPGLTVNPDTPVESVADYLATVDEVLCMSVYPGFGGQSFMPVALAKLRWLRQQRPDLDISIDGGINLETAVRSAEAGANIFDVGTTLFRATDMAEDIAAMRAQTRDAFGKRVNENAPEVASR